MKRIIAVFFVITLSMYLCACSSKESEDAGVSDANQSVIDSEEEAVGNTSSGFPASMPEFSTVDLQGNTVTEEIFSNADLTVVNLWATYCNPCINELPELGEWAKEMPDQVQIIGIVVDAGSGDSDEFALAAQIVEKTGAGYPHLAAAGQFDDIFAELIGVPTTIFVDKEGNIVGDPIIGADVDGYKNFVEEYIHGQN